MQLSFEKIKEITIGAAAVWQESDGVHFGKCTAEQIAVYEECAPWLVANAKATTGCKLDFHTDGSALVLKVKDEGRYEFKQLSQAKRPPFGMMNTDLEEQAVEKVTQLKADGDTAGGGVEIRVHGLKCGFGSMMTYAEKLDAQLTQGLMSIQAIKGVEVGAGFAVTNTSGKDVHDEIFYDSEKGFYRQTNRAGGIEGGMSNGEEIVLRAAMKPIPTLMRGLQTVDYTTKEKVVADTERSDVCAIFALEIIAEAVGAEVVANAVSKRLGGDTMEEVKQRYDLLP